MTAAILMIPAIALWRAKPLFVGDPDPDEPRSRLGQPVNAPREETLLPPGMAGSQEGAGAAASAICPT
jgi:hypothetical protein